MLCRVVLLQLPVQLQVTQNKPTAPPSTALTAFDFCIARTHNTAAEVHSPDPAESSSPNKCSSFLFCQLKHATFTVNLPTTL
jgi:hypothetical protein